jgi:hypothetical protein
MDHPRFNAPPSVDTFLAAILGQPDPSGAAAFAAAILGEDAPASAAAAGDDRNAASAAFAAAILREYDPDQPRDERGRWTADGADGGSEKETKPPRKIEQKDLDVMVEKLKNTKGGKALFDKAEKVAKDAGNDGLTIKAEPKDNMPDGDEGAMNPSDGRIGIRNDLSDAKMLETIIVELGNMARGKALQDLQSNGLKKMTRDEYIEAMEKQEFESVKDTARLWKSVAQDCGQDPSECPSYGKPDDVLKMDFKTHFQELPESHKEFYGKQWDDAHSGTK